MTAPPPVEQRLRRPPAHPRRRITRRDVLATVVATAAALAAVVFLRQGLTGLGTLSVAIAGYVVFAGVLFGFELRGRRREAATGATVERDPSTQPLPAVNLIDLTAAGPGVDPATLVDVEPVVGGAPGPSPDDDQPTRRSRVQRSDLIEVTLAALAAGAFAGIIRTVWGLHGPTGTVLWWYVGFLVVFYALVRDRADAESALDRIVTVVTWSIGLLVVSVLTWMMVFLIAKGLPALRPGFFTTDLSKVGPLTPGGGALHAIVGTFEQVGLAILIVVPISILTAVYLHEMRGILAKPVRLIVDAMSGLPSIVAGLLIFTVWVNGRGYSGAAGSAALVVLMLPTVTRTSEEILRTIPDSLREASLALGAPQWRVVLRVVLPTARAGLVTAVILGVARGVGETAPMLLTAFGSDSLNLNPFKGPQEDLPLFVWKLIRLPNQTQINRGFTGLLILVLLVLVLFTTARYIAGRGQRKLGRNR